MTETEISLLDNIHNSSIIVGDKIVNYYHTMKHLGNIFIIILKLVSGFTVYYVKQT